MPQRHKFQLAARLRCLADWVEPSSNIADIGTDHAYLPVWLVLQGLVSRAIAGDLRKGPLANAKSVAARYDVLDQISFRLCDGLADVTPMEVDTIIIAGMGGENIADILRAAPWTADGTHTMLLQPMSRVQVLRHFLADNGYRIIQERLVRERGTLYTAMQVTAGQMTVTPGQAYGGIMLETDPLQNENLRDEIIRMQIVVNGLRRSTRPADIQQADHLRDIIRELLEMREEWRHANR